MITVQKEEELNDYGYVWSKIGDKPNKITIYSQYSYPHIWDILYSEYKITAKNINVNTEAYNLEDTFISNHKYLVTVIEGMLYMSFFEFGGENVADSYISNVTAYYSPSLSEEERQKFVEKLQQGIILNGEQASDKNEKIINCLKLSYQNGYDLDKLALGIDSEDIKYLFNANTFKNGNKIIHNINKKSNTISILYGDNGTGKTKHLNYILSKIKKNVIYIPYQLISHSITEYEFLNFISKFKDAVFVIDDCEDYVTNNSYDKNNFFIKSLVQLTDGLLGINMNFNFLLSVNVSSESEIDEYLWSNTNMYNYYGKLNLTTIKKLCEIYNVPAKKLPANKEITIKDFFRIVKNKDVTVTKIGY